MEERERVPYSTSSRSNGQVLTFYVGYWVMRREEGGRPTAPRPGRPPIGAFSIGVIFLSFRIFYNTLFSSFFSVSFRRHQKLTIRGGIFVLFLLCLWKESGSFSLFWSLSLLLFLFPLLWGSTGHGISLLASGGGSKIVYFLLVRSLFLCRGEREGRTGRRGKERTNSVGSAQALLQVSLDFPRERIITLRRRSSVFERSKVWQRESGFRRNGWCV